MVNIESIHPYLMNGLAIFARMLLLNPSVRVQEDMIKHIATLIQNGIPLLSCLGGNSYLLMMKQLDPANASRVSRNLST
jgi:hypothetical protein